MKKTLFYTFIAVFVATALITLLGLINIVPIDPEYLDKLFYLLIAETVLPVIALFKKTSFFEHETPNNGEKNSSKMNVVMLPPESFPRKSDPHRCTITILNTDTDEERKISPTPKRANGYLSVYLDTLSEKELIKVHLINSQDETWVSEYFSPNIAKAEMEQA